jgi:hypothetical protein
VTARVGVVPSHRPGSGTGGPAREPGTRARHESLAREPGTRVRRSLTAVGVGATATPATVLPGTLPGTLPGALWPRRHQQRWEL